jgi:hypothetical protein
MSFICFFSSLLVSLVMIEGLWFVLQSVIF